MYLIGGGIKEGETALEALLRESLEETGHKINVRCFLGKAENHWVSSNYPNWSQHNIGFFYLCQLEERVFEPIEKEPLLWVSLSDLEKNYFMNTIYTWLKNL